MKTEKPIPIEYLTAKSPDFSLVLGGPLFQLFLRTHLAGDTLELVKRRLILGLLITWLPLLLLSAFAGQLLGGAETVPFLKDIEIQIRLLLALPLLIIAELVVHQRMRFVFKEFLERQLVPENARVRFDSAIASAFRLRDSVMAEVLMLAFVYGVGLFIYWNHIGALQATTWQSVPDPTSAVPSLAGLWFHFLSLPIFQFLMLRWYFRVFVWTRLLWQMSRIDLSLVPTHPDRVGGLGFLSETAFAFVLLAMAHGTAASGWVANRIFHDGARLPDFMIEIAIVVGLVLILAFGPLMLFAAQLARAKRRGLREYGKLAACYVRMFDAKWLRGGAAADESLVGSADIQSLADMANSFQVVKEMDIAPVTRAAIIRLAVATLLPIAPLLLTMMPLAELLKRLLGILF